MTMYHFCLRILSVVFFISLFCCSFAVSADSTLVDVGPDRIVTAGEQVLLQGTIQRETFGTNLHFHWSQVLSPDVIDTLDSFECPVDWSDQYATWVRGRLHPPVTGDYTFWIASDDGSELYLSTDQSPENKRKIAEVTDWTSDKEWDKFPSQKSAPVKLEKVKAYYIEAIQVEGDGGDNLAVAWQYPGQKRAVIAGSFLSPAGKNTTGSITREVWKNSTESTVASFLQSPRVTPLPENALSNPDSFKTTFVPPAGGIYLFELEVSDGVTSVSDRVSVKVTSSLQNGDFESGDGTMPAFWSTGSQQNKGVGFTWEKGGGVDNSRCVSITVTNAAGADAWWNQTLFLAPHSAYSMKGRVKGENIRIVPKEKGGNGGNISVRNLWKCSSNRENTTGTFGWTEFIIDFATSESGQADISGRIGYSDNNAAGKVWFDDISVQPNTAVSRFTSKHFVLNLYTNQVALATTAGVANVMANLDWLYEGYSNLSGAIPFGGCTISAWYPKRWNIQAGGWSGNPILWSGDPFTNWTQKGYLPAVFMHEYGHDFDNSAWSFHAEFFAEFFRYYCRDALKMYNAEEPRHWASAERWKEGYKKEWQEEEWASVGGFLYKFSQVKDRIGWKPFEIMFRSFQNLPAAEMLKTRMEKINRIVSKLSEYSGTNVWNFFTDKEKAMIDLAFNPPVEPPPTALADLDDAVKTYSLSDAAWDEAIVGWGAPERNCLEGGRPMLSGEGSYTKGLYAHAQSKYSFTLGGTWKTLTGIYGQQKNGHGSVVFVIKGDGKELLRSDVIKDDKEHPFSVGITGVNQLDLIVENGGDGINGDWGMWFDPIIKR